MLLARETCATPPVAGNLQLVFDLLLHDGAKEQLIKLLGGEIFASDGEICICEWKPGFKRSLAKSLGVTASYRFDCMRTSEVSLKFIQLIACCIYR